MRTIEKTDQTTYLETFTHNGQLVQRIRHFDHRPQRPDFETSANNFLSLICRLQEKGQDQKTIIQNQSELLDIYRSKLLSSSQNLDSCTDVEHFAPEGGNPMAYERIRVLMGTDSNLKPIYKQISGKTQDQRNDNIVKAYIDSGRIWEFMSSVPSHTTTAPITGHPFSEYAEAWNARYKQHLRATTAVTQKGWLDELCRFFGSTPIESLTVNQIQDYVNSIQKNTSGTIDQKLTFLGEILNAACEDSIIEKNPAKSSRLRLGGRESKGIEALPKEVIKGLIEKIRISVDLQIKFYLALMLYTGLRREEMLGLRWEDVDFDSGVLHIERAITYPSSKPVIGPTKTPKSERDIPMPDELVSVLTGYRQEKGYLVADEDGEPFNDYGLKKLRKAAREYAGLPKLDARELRHSYASMLHAAGIETRAVGACLGHTKSATTDRYIQVEQSRLAAVRNAGIDYAVS